MQGKKSKKGKRHTLLKRVGAATAVVAAIAAAAGGAKAYSRNSSNALRPGNAIGTPGIVYQASGRTPHGHTLTRTIQSF